jgi:hypothetical protein
MQTLKRSVLFSLVTAILAWGEAEAGMYDRQTQDGRNLYQTLLTNGVPREALELTFRFFDYNQGRIDNTDASVIVDYSRPSTEKRLLLMNFQTGLVERFYVSHGINSGVVETRSFSNLTDSWKSSLGFYYAQGTYTSGKNGLSLVLDGIDRSNDNARPRTIVLHGAKYVSDEFIAKNKRLGWSEGCFAVSLVDAPYLINLLQSGSVLLSYHADLMAYARKFPYDQGLEGDEVIAPDVNRKRTPGEGGGT